jgi:hypothetical protein
MKKEYNINGYGSSPYFSTIVEYVFNPQNFSLELKYQGDVPTEQDIKKYIQEVHPLLNKKGIKSITKDKSRRSNEDFSNYSLITVTF